MAARLSKIISNVGLVLLQPELPLDSVTEVIEMVREFGQQKKIFYVHFRNVVGKVPKYTEVFPHEGDGDMVANLKALKEVGYHGYVSPEHHIGLVGDTDWMHRSRAWQVGYIKGLMQALNI